MVLCSDVLHRVTGLLVVQHRFHFSQIFTLYNLDEFGGNTLKYSVHSGAHSV